MQPAPPPTSRHSQRGSGWLEFGVAAIVLSVLAAILLDRVIEYEEYAEKTGVDLTLLSLRATLRWRQADLMIRGRSAELAAMAGANPVAWLERPPAGYLGEHSGSAKDISGGSWYFDLDTRELVFVPSLDRHLSAPDGQVPRLAWRIEALKSAAVRDVDAPVTGLVLAQTGSYRWF